MCGLDYKLLYTIKLISFFASNIIPGNYASMSKEHQPQIPESILYYSEREGYDNAALIFPGQGIQAEGMGRNLCEVYPEIRQEIYDKADRILSGRLKRLGIKSILDLTNDHLTQTKWAQPALFTNGVACATALVKQRKIAPNCCLGNSFGELIAFWAAGAYTFEDGLRIVIARGEALQEACDANPGGLFALKLPELSDKATVESIIRRLKAIGVTVEAYNSPRQLVFAGRTENLKQGKEWIKGAYGESTETVDLNAAGAFHTKDMKPAEKRVTEVIDRLIKLKRIKKTKIPVIANTTAKPINTPNQIRKEIKNHLTMPVLWAQSIEYVEQQREVAATIELGGGKNPLSKMMKDKGKMVIILGAGAGAIAVLGTVLYFRRRHNQK